MKTLLITGLAAVATIAASVATADINTRTHYRCWDDTLRVSHGGWVSYQRMARANCNNAKRAYPNNNMWVQSERY